jgi:SPOR domain
MSAATRAAPPTPDPRAEACPSCGADVAPGQEWCLQCGAPTRTRVVRPPGLRVPAAILAVVILLAGAAVAVAFVALSNDSTKVASGLSTPTTAATPSVASTPPASATPTTATPTTPGSASPTTPTAPGATATTPAAPTTTPGTTTPGTATPTTPGTTTPGAAPPTAAPAPPAGWPSGRTAYTVVMLSSPSRARAEAFARRYAAQGVAVGVLDSSRFASLRPGYWVVFSGQYAGLAPAEAAAQRLQARGVGGAYGRLVKPG